jgi:hypothetical protein
MPKPPRSCLRLAERSQGAASRDHCRALPPTVAGVRPPPFRPCQTINEKLGPMRRQHEHVARAVDHQVRDRAEARGAGDPAGGEARVEYPADRVEPPARWRPRAKPRLGSSPEHRRSRQPDHDDRAPARCHRKRHSTDQGADLQQSPLAPGPGSLHTRRTPHIVTPQQSREARSGAMMIDAATGRPQRHGVVVVDDFSCSEHLGAAEQSYLARAATLRTAGLLKPTLLGRR